jgi:hypothetical protein
METYNNLYLNPNVKPILHIFELEEMFERVGTFVVWTNYKGLPPPFKIPKCLILTKLVRPSK